MIKGKIEKIDFIISDDFEVITKNSKLKYFLENLIDILFTKYDVSLGDDTLYLIEKFNNYKFIKIDNFTIPKNNQDRIY